MSSVVLDASALIALLCNEVGSDIVARHMEGAMLSTVNLSEIYSKSADKHVSLESLTWSVKRLPLHIVPFSDVHATIAGSLREATRAAGLSLGDRACLALGIEQQRTVLTTDHRWKEPNLPVDVMLIR